MIDIELFAVAMCDKYIEIHDKYQNQVTDLPIIDQLAKHVCFSLSSYKGLHIIF